MQLTYFLRDSVYRRFEVQQCDRQEPDQRIRAFPASGTTARQDVHRRQRHEKRLLDQFNRQRRRRAGIFPQRR